MQRLTPWITGMTEDPEGKWVSYEDAKKRIEELEAFARTVVDEVLFPLSHRQDDDLSLIAEGLGSQSASLLNPK